VRYRLAQHRHAHAIFRVEPKQVPTPAGAPQVDPDQGHDRRRNGLMGYPLSWSIAMYSRILIAIDGSELAAHGLTQGLALASALGATVDIVTVSEPWAMGMYDAMGWSVAYERGPEYQQQREEAAQNILVPAIAAAEAAGVAAAPCHMLDRYAADGILEAAHARRSELIVMTSHGRRGMSRVLLGSQTAEVLARSTVPVLVVR
jgi:nucleotide-binding universal stress UspA family protein